LHDTPHSKSKPKKSGPMDGKGRRSIYQEIRRNYLPGFLVAFDMTNSSEPFGRRNITNVPAQSLALLNDPFVTGQAAVWAQKVLAQNSLSFKAKVEYMHRQIFSRPARQQELKWARSVFSSIAKEKGIDENQAVKSPVVWLHFCHVMFNRKEMLYKF
ncbi:MAG: DUF1553 domain-containing protein, partial [Lentisphaeraceae bacterium]|nr:DUF1553 domain-containing protein [Lentisphaeraceae bacterium]